MVTKCENINKSQGQPDWLELYDLSLHSDTEVWSPKGAYIQGKIIEEQHFFTTS